MCLHRSLTRNTLIVAGPKKEMNNGGVAKDFDILFDEIHCRSNLHPVCAPAKFSDRGRITTTNQIDPESLAHIGNEFNNFNRKVAVANIRLQIVNEGMDMIDDRRCFDQGVDTGHENLLPFSDWRGQLLHRFEQKHGEGGTVFSTTEADYPRDVTRLSIESRQVDHDRP